MVMRIQISRDDYRSRRRWAYYVLARIAKDVPKENFLPDPPDFFMDPWAWMQP
jgi:hypothetical protein